MKKLAYIIFLLAFAHISFSQEYVVGLGENPVLKEYLKKEAETSLKSSKLETWTPVVLPFFDDFKKSGPYPDTSRWLDNEAFVNKDFGKFSANLGVATLDAIDANGYIYSNASVFPFLADRLTSRPIRLDSVFEPIPAAITTQDSVYFSFFYQPQGYGDHPQEQDSLVLQFGHYGEDSVFYSIDSIQVALSDYLISPNDTVFPGDTLYSPCDSTLGMPVFDTLYYDDYVMVPCDSIYYPEINWNDVWSTQGMKLDSFQKYNGTYSKQVIIPILDSAKYYRPDFFFRFFNYASLDETASLRSNSDMWNIDYVYLNIGRSAADTFYRDIGFVERSPSMIRDYEMMPYDQYLTNPTNSLKDTFQLYITNLDDNTFNTVYDYKLSNADGTFEREYNGGVCNLPPFTQSYAYQNCNDCPQHACPPWKFLFPLDYSKESEVFKIEHTILGDITSSDTIRDTMTYYQRFYNFYAYDDGVPESGYGVFGNGAKVGLRYTLNRPDTMHGVQMFVNRTQNNANDIYFHLAVWRDNNGTPGELIYIKENIKPQFSQSLNRISYYEFDEPVPVNNVFHVGWIQDENKYLNVGFDRFNNAREQLHYYVPGSGWFESIYEGALMIRPVMSDKFITALDEKPSTESSLSIFPNPVKSGILNIRISGMNISFTYKLFNSYGQLIRSGRDDNRIQTANLASGMYLLQVRLENGEVVTRKIMIAR
ncbi:MAG: T9SS type A sorting domain-containing protein [Bacteroidales bacterium]|nr:T9SS type A sorting domain-containing protein [Bacteroidales bacterium]MCF8398329.1 T9SS type A sorting domain-containing protein [Bacteroidales bacterium]